MIIASVLLLVSQAVQPATPPTLPVNAIAPCRVIDARHADDGPSEVYAVCSLSSVRLGTAEFYSSSINLRTGKTLVARRSKGHMYVSLVWASANGAPVVVDVSRDVEQAAVSGGIVKGALQTIDVSRFAASGQITIFAVNAGAAPIVIDLTRHL